MSGGTVSNNIAKGAGGGIFVQCNTMATITGGTISNNKALDEYNRAIHAGGGIYVNGYHNNGNVPVPNGKLYMFNVELANNIASGEGGALAWCGSGSGAVGSIHGTVIHDNENYGGITNVKVNGEIICSYDNVNTDVLIDNIAFKFTEKVEGRGDFRPYWTITKLNLRDYPVVVGDVMLNGAQYNWKDENGKLVNDQALKNSNKAYKLSTDATYRDSDVQESVKLAKVHVLGNESSTNGGGIASNGDLYIGTYASVDSEYEGGESGVKDEYEEKSKGRVKGVHTGDDSDITMLAVLMMVSAASIATMYIRRRRAGR